MKLIKLGILFLILLMLLMVELSIEKRQEKIGSIMVGIIEKSL